MKLSGTLSGYNFEAINQNHYLKGHHKIPRIWVVVVDRHRARIFRKPDGHLEQVGEAVPLAGRKPVPKNAVGRVFSSANHYIRHCLSGRFEKDRLAAREFVEKLSEFLQQALDKDAYDRLVLAAPPKVLGDFRKYLPAHVQNRIVAEVNKDLTKMTEKQLMEEINSIIWF